jgi:UDP-N-acetylglucosamine--N-acetylmuramyl-(pentapeptide) pyrophosphoryl-undecaprenol N-acetylglucosamine transferase
MCADVPKKIRLLVAGGGTGGHLYPALAIVEAAAARGILEDVLFVGTQAGIEAQKVPARGYRLEYIWISGLRRSLKPENLLFPVKLVVSLCQAARIIRQFKPTDVLGTGGYVSGPVLYLASRRGIPTLIQEQNSYPGITTRLLATRVDRVHLSFEASRKFFKRQDNLILTGNPVASGFSLPNRQAAYQKFHLDSKMQTIVVTGGSQGAHALNQAVFKLLDWLMAYPQFQLVWSTGQVNFELIQTQCQRFPNRIWVRPFIEDMPAAYAIGDLAIGRAGALTLTELAISGVPAILIPYPYATGQHQLYNAQVLAAAGAALVIEEANLTPENLFADIFSLLNNPNRLANMRSQMLAWANPNAAQEIVDSLLKIAIK